MTPKNTYKIFIPQKKFIFLKPPKNIDIQNFEPQKMTLVYECMKISEYPPPWGQIMATLKRRGISSFL